jgi:hypothetical protein
VRKSDLEVGPRKCSPSCSELNMAESITQCELSILCGLIVYLSRLLSLSSGVGNREHFARKEVWRDKEKHIVVNLMKSRSSE